MMETMIPPQVGMRLRTRKREGPPKKEKGHKKREGPKKERKAIKKRRPKKERGHKK